MVRFMVRELLPLQKVGGSMLSLPILDKCTKGKYSMVKTALAVAGLVRFFGSCSPVFGRLHCNHMAVGYTDVK